MIPLVDEYRDRQGFYVLKRKYSELYKRVNYRAKVSIVQNRIIEYDIRSANTSILRQTHMMKKSMLDTLDSLPSKDRKVFIGKIIKREKKLQRVISQGVIRAKRDLFQANSIQDVEVLSIKNDAVFIIGRKLRTTKFGEFIEFRPKNVYSLYMNIEKIEFYYDQKANRVDVKGVNDLVVNEPDHQAGMMQFFAKVMRYIVYDRRDALRRYLIEFSIQYKEKALPVQYYRELNGENVYRTYMELDGYSFNLIVAGEDDKPDINGVYNYKRFILPLIQLYV